MSYDASTGTMCFSEALGAIKKGGKVRRADWRAGMWVALDRSERFQTLFIRLPNGKDERWMRPMDDLLAEDWMEALIPYGAKP